VFLVLSPRSYILEEEEYTLPEFFKDRTMEETFVPFQGIKNDLRGRLMCYKQDWTGGFRAGFR
jgi:hypothetical protein